LDQRQHTVAFLFSICSQGHNKTKWQSGPEKAGLLDDTLSQSILIAMDFLGEL
jgi:hypothetical protein